MNHEDACSEPPGQSRKPSKGRYGERASSSVFPSGWTTGWTHVHTHSLRRIRKRRHAHVVTPETHTPTHDIRLTNGNARHLVTGSPSQPTCQTSRHTPRPRNTLVLPHTHTRAHTHTKSAHGVSPIKSHFCHYHLCATRAIGLIEGEMTDWPVTFGAQMGTQ